MLFDKSWKQRHRTGVPRIEAFEVAGMVRTTMRRRPLQSLWLLA